MLNRNQLKQTLKNIAKYNSLAFSERTKLSEHCIEKYGYDPAEIDNDDFIDACEVGDCAGMSVDEFNKSMEYYLILSGKK